MNRSRLVDLLVLIVLGWVTWAILHKPGTDPNFVLITVDTLRRDHLGCYGSSTVRTPNIDALADSGVVFENYYTAANITIPSHLSILSGQYPGTYGIYDNESHFVGKLPLLPGILRRDGYFTAGITAVHFLSGEWLKGLGEQFDVFRRPELVLKGDQIVNELKFVLPLIKFEKFFLWIHLFDPHVPYDAHDEVSPVYSEYLEPGGAIPFSSDPPPSLTWLQEKGITSTSIPLALYKGEVTYTDLQIGKILRLLDNHGLRENTITILTADHGEMLGQREVYYDHATLYDPIVHSPLIIQGPLWNHRKASSVVSGVDIAPTLLELAGIGRPLGMDGASLLPFMKNDKRRSRPVFSYHARNDSVAVVDYPYKLIHTRPSANNTERFELYNLQQDSAEAKDLFVADPATGDRMKSLLRQDRMVNQRLSTVQSELLLSLGYVQ